MLDKTMFFDGWPAMARVFVLAVLGYSALIVMLRVSRKRTLAQMNVFDFVYVVVMGELLATTIISGHVALLRGLFALGLLIGLQALVSWLTTRSVAVEHFVNGEPTLLLHRGRFLHDALAAQRVTENEVRAAVREEGVASLDDVDAVVLETNGEFSVVHSGSRESKSALADVPGAGDGEEHAARRPRRARGDAEREAAAVR